MAEPKDAEDPSLRVLVLGVHTKLDDMRRSYDEMRRSYLRLFDERMEDRHEIHRHSRRIQRLEHQVALLSGAAPGVDSWHPEPPPVTGQRAIVPTSKDDDDDEIDT